MLRRLKIVVVLLMAVVAGNGQDLHFSQWFNTPLLTNPANTGFIPDADYRLGVNYRNQWSTIMSVPYKTMSAWGDAQVFRDRIQSGWVGIGGAILRDVAGSGSLTSTRVFASIGYHQMISDAHLLSIGFNAGVANKRVNTSELKFPDQFDGKFFDNKLPTSVFLDNPNITYFDFQTGINYAYFPTENLYVNGGFSAQHLNRPRESFFAADSSGVNINDRIPVRYTAFANTSYKMSDELIVNGMAYYSRQSTASEIVAGANLQYNLSGDGESQLIGGLYYRPGDAFIPVVGYQWRNIRLMFSYDATTSSLKQYNNGRGAFEFALIHNGFYSEYNGDRRQSFCPTF